MSEKPVYIAGVGFSDEQPPPRWRLPLIIGLAGTVLISGLVIWLAAGSRTLDRCMLLVESTPPGAAIWLDLELSAHTTPSEFEVDATRDLLVQVRAPGMQADPLAWQLTSAELQQGHVLCSFQLKELAAPYRPREAEPAPQNSLEDQPADPVVVQPARPRRTVTRPDEVREQPAAATRDAGVPAATDGVHLLHIENWDPGFRLRIDGREQAGAASMELAPGPHRVQVDLLSIMQLDTLLLDGGTHRLALPGSGSFVEVRVHPATGSIISGEHGLGRGRALVPRLLLPMTVRFPAMPGLLPPPEMQLKDGAPLRVEAMHLDPIHYSWEPGNESGLRLAARGYVLPAEGFVADRERGPEEQDGSMLLGRAFHDRRPGGVHCLRFSFELPASCHEGWPAELRLVAGDSRERFPLTLARNATLSVFINGVALSRDMKLEQERVERSWPVSRLLQPGSNLIELRNTEEARSKTRIERLDLVLE